MVNKLLLLSLFLAVLTSCQTASQTPTEAIVPTNTVTLAPTVTNIPEPTLTPEVIELNPSPRGYVSMAYDSESGQLILFGGQTSPFGTPNSETWAYDVSTNEWTNMKPDVSPPRGAAGSLIYDVESDRVILYGSAAGLKPSRDTWAYDFNLNTWTKMSAQGPAEHLGSQMAYDVESDRVILFAGYSASNNEFFNDTHIYDFNTDTWIMMEPNPVPPGRNFHCMTYNTKADRVIIWGGDMLSSKDTSVWAYDFNTDTWEENITNNGPEVRDYCGMVYSTETDKVLMYGGYSSGSSDMWIYDYSSNIWTELNPDINPGDLSRFAFVYVPDPDQIILFGGQLGDATNKFTQSTWVYDLKAWTWTETTRDE